MTTIKNRREKYPEHEGASRGQMIEEHRRRIKTAKIIERLQLFIGVNEIKNVVDERNAKMSSVQVTAALGLLKKTLPDLASVTIEDAAGKTAKDFTMEELIAIVSRARAGNVREGESGQQPPEIH